MDENVQQDHVQRDPHLVTQLTKLYRILQLEAQRRYDDKAVFGGLQRFLEVWQQDLNHAPSPEIQRIITALDGYAERKTEERQTRIDEALTAAKTLLGGEPPRSKPAPPRSNGKKPRSEGGQVMQTTMQSAISEPISEPSEVSSNVSSNVSSERPPSKSPSPQTASQSPSRPISRPTTAETQPASTPIEPSYPIHDTPLPEAPASLASLALETPLSEIDLFSKKDVQAFRRLGVKTVEDMLYHVPHRYDNYATHKKIIGLQPGQIETVVVEIVGARTFPIKRSKQVMGIEVQVGDDTGIMKVVFFGNKWMLRQFTTGRKIVLSGKVTLMQDVIQMKKPNWEPYQEDEMLNTGRIVPVHPLTKGLQDRNARKLIKKVIDRTTPTMADFLPDSVRERVNLLPLGTAILQIHFPQDQGMLHHARRRLGFDEFFCIQMGVLQRRLHWQAELGAAITISEEVHNDLLSHLPFRLTNAQERALQELFSDMKQSIPMARLLQGDVGSGKTVVAAAVLAQTVANGMQGALMAPTEILAEQHYQGLRSLLRKVRIPRRAQQGTSDTVDDGHQWKTEMDDADRTRLEEIKRLLGMTVEDDMEGEGIRVALLTGSLGKRDRRKVTEGVAKGEIDLVIGTHALITEDVYYHSLGLVCIDEQHRFGVEQRERLKQKGMNPHLLVMTATPIPRTLTLTIYGDLNTSILDELPPGRQQIRTRVVSKEQRPLVYKHIRQEVEKGRQIFVICPLVEESEKLDLPSAEEMHEYLQKEIFPSLQIGLIHGRILPREKDETMRAFHAGEYHILVATSVVEVGIDVPNATTIVIEGAERFGLSQLHQFRGRVGRGQHQSYCVLVSNHTTDETNQRLEAMEQSSNGFELAEIDLQLRGPGEFFGKRQSGTPDLKVARLADTHLLTCARQEAERVLQDDPSLGRPEHQRLKQHVHHFWEHAEGAS